MIKKFYGYSIAAIGLIGIVFFRYYAGSLIPHTTLWYILSIGLFLFGFYFAFSSKSKKEITEIKNSWRIDKIKSTGEKIKLNFDDCEFKENNYYEEVTHNNVRDEPFATLFHPNGNREETILNNQQ
jgi:hypothetical protein